MRYEEALQWLHAQQSPVKRPGLERIRYALAYLGHPERKLPSLIHVAGTNGKGSTVAFLRNLFQTHGLRVGSFTSPHMMDWRERMMINDQLMTEQTFIDLVRQCQQLNDHLVTTEWNIVSGFELYVVMMILYFAEQVLDVIIVEVGIGGLLDATNILDGDIGIITSIGLDHTDMLGETLVEIAQQKAGIIKPGQQVFIGEVTDEVFEAIQHIGKKAQCIERFGQEFYLDETGYHDAELSLAVTLGLQGQHQKSNAAVALRAFQAWMLQHQQIMDHVNVQQALLQTKWAGRLEQVMQQPLIILDGAHNVAGLTQLKHVIEQAQQELPQSKVTVLYAGIVTKNQAEHLKLLASLENVQVILTTFDFPKAMQLTDWQALPHSFEMVEDWRQWLEHYMALNRTVNQQLYITGSLYFISDVRGMLLN